jgi:succinylarginine dihydrolase
MIKKLSSQHWTSQLQEASIEKNIAMTKRHNDICCVSVPEVALAHSTCFFSFEEKKELRKREMQTQNLVATASEENLHYHLFETPLP